MNSKILLTDDSFNKNNPEVIKLMNDSDLEFVEEYNPDDIVGILAGVDKVYLNKFKNLKVISRFGTGIDNINLKEAKERNVLVYNTPHAPSDSVAELTIMLMLQLLRKNRELLLGKTVGIIGLGSVGTAVLNILVSFGTKTIFNDIKYEHSTPLDELFRTSNIISLHVPLDKSTYQLIGIEEISKMKKKPIIINTSRELIVNRHAIIIGLEEGRISGFGSDVNDANDFKNVDNVIITPHIGSDTKETRYKMEVESVKNLIVGLEECLK